MARSKLALLLLLYPGFAWLLSWMSGDLSESRPPQGLDEIAEWVRAGVYAVIAVSFAFLLAVPFWSARYRKEPQKLPAAFRRGLYVASVLLAIILPVQGVLLALALYVAGPDGLWFWGLVAAGGATFALLVLRQCDFSATPDIYLSLWASRLQLKEHPKLDGWLRELCEALAVPPPRHILVGLQPELLATIGTVFCPEGELDGGTLCFSLPTCSVLSLDEFRFLTGEALLGLHAGVGQNRKHFLSTFESARDVLASLDESRRDWTWIPRWGLHPAFIGLWLAVVAAMKFPLYLGREWISFYVREICSVRQTEDIKQALQAHRASTYEVGAVQAVSALIKEAAVTLGLRFNLSQPKQAWHGLNEVAQQAFRQHEGLAFDRRPVFRWPDPASAWQYLEFRGSLSGVSLEWCRFQALNVSPYEPATSLFANPALLQERLVEVARIPLLVARG